jgi:outer membrane protein assembly factor BamB
MRGTTIGKLAVPLFAAALVAGNAAGAVGATGDLGAVAPAVVASAPDWPVYHLDSGRSGNYASFPAFGGTITPGWSTPLDGAVYAEPLVVHGTVIAATEGDTVYALDPAAGTILWQKNLGTPVPKSTLPCGNIDPLGITGTPAYDPATGSIFAVAEVTGPQHVLFALDSATGAVRWSRNVDLAGDDPTTHQQRPALAVANGYVYIGLGGLAGDCGQYVGEVVGVPTSGSGSTISYKVPTSREGAVWATGGPVIDGSGNLYVSVGNGASTTTFDGSDSVLELSPTLQLKSSFAPSTWATDNANDADLGSLAPTLLPGGWVFIAGKSGTGYVLRQGALGGIGGQVSSAAVCAGFGGTAFSGTTVYVPCSGSVREVQVGSNGSLAAGWQTSAAGGPPVLGGGAVWSVNIGSGHLVALNPTTGATMASIAVGAVPHFVSPTLWQNQIFVGTLAGITSVSVEAASTYHPLTPTRLLDTRSGTGLSGVFHSHVARTFQVTGGVVPAAATAVTGNLTVTQQTSLGYLTIGPVAEDQPSTSTLNFPTADDRANAVTVALGTGGKLSITYAAPALGPTAQVIFDVTGYFTADSTGGTYHGLAPTRLLDTRFGTGLSGPFQSHLARTFSVAGGGGPVPANATAVTGTLTVTTQTSRGYLYVGPTAVNDPASSNLNFPLADDRANAVTVALGAGGTLSITYAAPTLGPTADVIFDVTGYFTPDATGARYTPLLPARILDSRIGAGLSGPFQSHVARTFQATGSVVPGTATAVTGNVTVTQQNSRGFVFVGPDPANDPSSSSLNFPVGDDRACGVTVGLGGAGTLSATYAAPTLGKSAHLIFDVTGYFAP